MTQFKVTPWDVEGLVDYKKLIEMFGTQPIDQPLLKRIEKHTGELHVFLRRGFAFSHRDMDKVLDDYEKGKGFFLYTGRGPSGNMTLGHLVPFLFTKWLQDKFGVNLYIEITDDEKFLVKDLELNEVQKYAEDNILDIAAVGFDSEKTFIFRDTEYIAHMYEDAIKVGKKINFSNVRAVFGFTNQTNIGMIFYPTLQIVPTLFEKKRCLIPAAIDQDPYWRVQRDIAESLGYHKAAAIHTKFLPSLQGPAGKMSTSDPHTAIYLTDSPEDVRRKIMKYAFSGGQPTVEEHRKKGGNPDVDTSFQWLYILFEEDDQRIEDIRNDYISGKLLTGELKENLIEKLTSFLKEHQKRKCKAERVAKKMKYTGKLAKRMWER